MPKSQRQNKNPQNEVQPNNAVTIDQERFDALMSRINQLENQLENQPATASQKADELAELSGGYVTPKGVQGIVFKYPIEAEAYPNPVEELKSIPELKRYAFAENYDLEWKVDGLNYEKYNITYAEPKFVCTLYQKMWDEDGNEIKGSRIRVSRHIMLQDDYAVKKAAFELGLADKATTESDFKQLSDRYRFETIKQWLIGGFQEYKPQQYKKKAKEMVVGGKVVVVEETNVLA